MEWLAVEWFFREDQGTNRKVLKYNTPLWFLYATFNGTLIDHDNLLTASN